MKKESLYYGLGGLIVGLFVAWSTATLSVNKDYRGMMQMMGMNTMRIQDKSAGPMGMSMNRMQMELQTIAGDNFDRDFLGMMIAHHQGAVNMASLAKQKANHAEIKTMADDIIATQTKEITMMRKWQTEWGYTDTQMMMGH